MSLFTKYRPNSWEDVKGQDHIISILKGILKRGTYKEMNSLVLGGGAGSGKTTISRLFAKAVNCLDKNNKPCNKCKHCQMFNAGEYPDYIEEDGATYNKKEDIQQLKDLANMYANVPNGLRIIYIDEAHALSNQAWDILLKLLEEGETRTIWIFATTEPEKIRPAIISRSMVFSVRPLGVEDIKEELINICKKEKIKYDNQSITKIATMYSGKTRDAIKTLDMYYKSKGDIVDIELSSSEEDMLDILKLAYFNKIDEAYKLLEKMIVIKNSDYQRILSNVLMSAYSFGKFDISFSIDSKRLDKFKEVVQNDIKNLINLYLQNKPNSLEDMKLYLLLVSELGIGLSNKADGEENSKTVKRKFVPNVDKHLGVDNKYKEKLQPKKVIRVTEKERKINKFKELGFS